MPLAVSSLVQPGGLLPTDLVPRTPDEVKAFAESETGYATDTAKTEAYVTAFLAAADADPRVDDDATATLYVYWRAYDARAQALGLMPRKGAADGEGSYEYDADQIEAAKATAADYKGDFLRAVSDPEPSNDYAGWPRVRSLR